MLYPVASWIASSNRTVVTVLQVLVLKRMFEYSRMNSKFLIFECIFSIRIFDHMLNTHIKHCSLCSIVLFHFTRNESKYKAIYDCHAWQSLLLNPVIDSSAMLVYLESKSRVYIERRQTFWIFQFMSDAEEKNCLTV